ncbi:hypothetical protein N1851_030101 [Merluccius polli]|uniref:Zinc finger PHD-type domain-containing protein n=1 Tax=Merluccius polli TaxID=89951 RepID=A0AA47M689_MERPO|nr:hypothetical protein N1851_030101 [Merluccius polli]
MNGIAGFSEDKQKAGYYWFEGFMKRNPIISLRKPEALSAARASGMNPTIVEKWFQTYTSLLNRLQIHDMPSHLWNCDESGLQDHFISKRVVGVMGKSCFQVTSGEKGETVTVLAGFNAVGTFTPTMVMFKGKRHRAEWLDNRPENAIVRVSDNGWINSQLFLEWGQRFVQQLPKEDARPHVLLLDGHYSHVFNLQFLELMEQNNVHVISYPPHTTHALQPADRSLFRSLKHHWQELGRKWTRKTGGKKLPKQLFFSVFTPAWKKTATVENAQAGFRASGMFPVRMEVIPTELFMPSLTTERVNEETPETILLSEEDIAFGVVEVVVTSQPDDDVYASTLSAGPATSASTPSAGPATSASTLKAGPATSASTLSAGPATSASTLSAGPATSTSTLSAGPATSTSTLSAGPASLPSTSTAEKASTVRFSDLIDVPTRERGKKRMVVRPPSYHLTSPEHFDFVRAKEARKKLKTTKVRKSPGVRPKKAAIPLLQTVQGSDPCTVCKGLYGDASDPKAMEEWVACCHCKKWFHESCGEMYGIMDDDDFICRECIV